MLEPVGATRRDFLTALAGLGTVSLCGAIAGPAPAAASGLPDLERQIETLVGKLRRQGLIRPNERTAWSVYDFVGQQKLASINENRPYQSASMLKPFVAQAYFLRHRQNPRRYPYNAEIRRLMERMIRYSNNPATNELIRRTGRGRSGQPRDVERLLKDQAGLIFRELSMVEFIPRSGRSYRNRASARDYSRFLYALWHDRLPYAGEIKHYMGLPNRDRLRDRVNSVPPGTLVFDKTGSTARLCGNMGILVGRGRDGRQYPYTLIGIIEKSRRARNYGRWLRGRSNVIREVSALTYQAMKQRYPLV